MGAIDDFADDVNGVVADLEAQFKVLVDKKRAVQERGNEIALRWAQYFDSRNQALTAAENALNRISNVPVSKTDIKATNDTGITKLPVTSP